MPTKNKVGLAPAPGNDLIQNGLCVQTVVNPISIDDNYMVVRAHIDEGLKQK